MVDPRGEEGSAPPGTTLTGRLLSAYLAGDREAERRVFEAHSAWLVRQAKGHRRAAGLRKHVALEDLVDEVFLRTLTSGKLAELAELESGALRRYLAGKLDDVVNDMYRRLGAAKRGDGRAPAPLEPAGDEPAAPRADAGLHSRGATPTSDLRARELVDLVRELLDAREWEIWRRCELEQESSVALASESGTSDAAVRGVLHRARKKVLLGLARRLGEPPRDAD